MQTRRWLVIAVFLSIVASACGSNTAPSTAPGGSSAPGDSSAPAGSQSPVQLLAARLNDPATAEQAAIESRAEIRKLRGIADVLGPDSQAMLDALDALEQELMNAALADLPGVLAGSSSVELASYVRPGVGRSPTTANPMVTALISVFLVPFIQEALDRGKGSFDVTQKEEKPTGGGSKGQEGTFTMHARYAGGALQGGFEGSFSETTGDPPNTKFVSETFATSFTITPCPDASGKVMLELTYSETSLASGPTANTRSATKVTIHALMNVNDDAELVGTDVSSHMEGSEAKTTSAGESTEGSSSLDMSFGVSAGGEMGSPAIAGQTLDGDPQRSGESNSAGLITTTFLTPAVNSAATTARKGWRNNKCVELTEVTPESKEVTAKEKVDIAATLKHRVTDEQLKKNVKATVDGKGTVEPAEADGPKVTYVYTAGDNPGDAGAVELKSVSNRGIATKTLTFTIRGKWTLAVHGTYTQMLGASAGGFTYGAELDVTVDAFSLSVDDAGQITGTGTIHFSGHPVFPPGTPCTGSYVSTETLKVTGKQQTYADGITRLTLTLSAPPGTVNSTIDCPGGIGGSTQFNMAGGFGGNLFNNTVSSVELPATGGSTPIDQKGSSSVWTTHAVLTFELTIAQ